MDKRKHFDGDFVVQRGNPGSFINNNIDGLMAYKDIRNKRMAISSENNEINNLKSDVDSLKNDISQIKDLLLKVLENK